MRKEKYELYMFEPEVYPFSLWVYIGNTDCGIQEHFNTPGEFENSEAATISVPYGVFKHGGHNGYIMWFKDRQRMTIKNIYHEATHVVMRVWEFIGEEPGNSEPLAYLAGWVAERCWMVKQKKADNFKI